MCVCVCVRACLHVSAWVLASQEVAIWVVKFSAQEVSTID